MNLEIIPKEPIVVTDPSELEVLVGHIHDEFFDLRDVVFSKDTGVVTIPYRRVFHGDLGRLISNWLLWKTYEVPVIQSRLIIRNVKEYSVEDRSRVGTYSFNTVSYGRGIVVIECCEDLDLRMVVSALEIESRDLERRGKTTITHGLFWTSGPGKIYD